MSGSTTPTGEIDIVEVRVREIPMTLVRAFETARGHTAVRRVIIVEVVGGGGLSGWSECVAPDKAHYTSETVDTAWPLIVDGLALLAAHRPWASVEQLAAALSRAAPTAPMAVAAVEMAARDLDARRRGLPLATVLGGDKNEIDAGVVIGLHRSIDSLVEEAMDAAARGYRRIKLKIAPGADARPLAAVREAVGLDVPLAVDGNGSYRLEQAESLVALERHTPVMIEQPLPAHDFTGSTRLQLLLSTPICLDESIGSAADVVTMHRLDAGRIVNLKPGRVGGHTAALDVHRAAVARAVPVWCGGMLETGIGRAHNVALASLPGFSMPGDLSPSDRYWERDIVDPPWRMVDGALQVPLDRPGIGVEVDVELVESLVLRRIDVTREAGLPQP